MAYDSRNHYDSSALGRAAYNGYGEMSHNRTSEAKKYDLSLFEPDRAGSAARTKRSPQTTHKGRPAVRNRNAANVKRTAGPSQKTAVAPAVTVKTAPINKALLLKRAAVCAVSAVLMMMFIISQVSVHEVTRSIQTKQHELSQLQQEYEIMMDQFNTEMSNAAIEDYATSVYGMQKVDSSQIRIISLDSDELFEFGESGSRWAEYTAID